VKITEEMIFHWFEVPSSSLAVSSVYKPC